MHANKTFGLNGQLSYCFLFGLEFVIARDCHVIFVFAGWGRRETTWEIILVTSGQKIDEICVVFKVFTILRRIIFAQKFQVSSCRQRNTFLMDKVLMNKKTTILKLTASPPFQNRLIFREDFHFPSLFPKN